MLRDGRARDRQATRDFAYRARPGGEPLEDLPPGRIGERGERGSGVGHEGGQAARSDRACPGIQVGTVSCTLLRAM